MKTLLLVVIFLVTTISTFGLEPVVRMYETVPYSSPNHEQAWRNIMTDAISKGTANVSRGLHNPRAVHMPSMLQIGGVLFTTELGYFGLNDGTNNAAFPFYMETGKGMAATCDYANEVPFLASEMSASVHFMDRANNWNMNVSIPNAFSPYFYGERWDDYGNVEVLTNGQSTATQLINRVVMFTGAYGFVVTRANLQQDNINYFLTSGPLTNTFSFGLPSGQVVEKSLSSNSRLRPVSRIIIFDGQRLPNFTFAVEKSPNLSSWSTIIVRTNNGCCLSVPTNGTAYFRTRETNSVVSNVSPAEKSPRSLSWKPVLGN